MRAGLRSFFHDNDKESRLESVDGIEQAHLGRLPSDIAEAAERAVDTQSSDDGSLQGHSLLMFGPQNKLRRALAALIWHPRFEHFIIVLIVLSSVVLALDSPRLDPNGTYKQVMVCFRCSCTGTDNRLSAPLATASSFIQAACLPSYLSACHLVAQQSCECAAHTN